MVFTQVCIAARLAFVLLAVLPLHFQHQRFTVGEANE